MRPRPASFKYLASPYSSPDLEVMEDRYQEAMYCTHWLLRTKVWVYSPIVHCHEMAKKHDLPRDYLFWQHYNNAMISGSDGIIVLAIPGWQESRGVTDELKIARRLGLEVTFALRNGVEYQLLLGDSVA